MTAAKLTHRLIVTAVAALAIAAIGVAAAPAAVARTAGSAVSEANGIEDSILDVVNSARKDHGVAPLRASKSLARAAISFGHDMAEQGFFSHYGPGGSSPRDRIDGYSAVGETLLWRSPDVTADEAVRLWLASPTHRAILLSPRLDEVGFGAVRSASAPGVFGGLPVTIVVADFGAR